MTGPSHDIDPKPPAGRKRSALALTAPRSSYTWATLLVVLTAVLGGGLFAILHPERTPGAVGALVEDLTGANPHPVRLLRPPAGQLSALAMLGEQIFFDSALSASGQQSCASCHSPEHAYGPPNDLVVQPGGAHMTEQGVRPPPSLAYLYRQPPFSIGPDPGETDNPVPLVQIAAQAKGNSRALKLAGAAPAAPAVVPQGGLFWDGRSNTLQAQASGPLMDPAEMANTSEANVAAKLARAKYSGMFKPLFGPNILHQPSLLVAEAMSAVSRYQIEDPSFHTFDSKYDAWLEGKAKLTRAELRGFRLFNDPTRANCAGCHLSAPSPDGLPPLFTDTQYEALGVPRNAALALNRDPNRYDLGLCGPYRTDLSKQTQYCGMFLTPTLRNVATRHVFFHNGIYRTLQSVLSFYNNRDTRPDQVYTKGKDGSAKKYDDIPKAYAANVDILDAPFNRKSGGVQSMDEDGMKDIIAFLNTLNDGYRPKN